MQATEVVTSGVEIGSPPEVSQLLETGCALTKVFSKVVRQNFVSGEAAPIRQAPLVDLPAFTTNFSTWLAAPVPAAA